MAENNEVKNTEVTTTLCTSFAPMRANPRSSKGQDDSKPESQGNVLSESTSASLKGSSSPPRNEVTVSALATNLLEMLSQRIGSPSLSKEPLSSGPTTVAFPSSCTRDYSSCNGNPSGHSDTTSETILTDPEAFGTHSDASKPSAELTLNETKNVVKRDPLPTGNDPENRNNCSDGVISHPGSIQTVGIEKAGEGSQIESNYVDPNLREIESESSDGAPLKMLMKVITKVSADSTTYESSGVNGHLAQSPASPTPSASSRPSSNDACEISPCRKKSLFEHLRTSFRRQQQEQQPRTAHDKPPTRNDVKSIGEISRGTSSSSDQEAIDSLSSQDSVDSNSQPSCTSQGSVSNGSSPPPTGDGPAARTSSSGRNSPSPTPEGCVSLHQPQHYQDNFFFTERLRWISKISRNDPKEKTNNKEKAIKDDKNIGDQDGDMTVMPSRGEKGHNHTGVEDEIKRTVEPKGDREIVLSMDTAVSRLKSPTEKVDHCTAVDAENRVFSPTVDGHVCMSRDHTADRKPDSPPVVNRVPVVASRRLELSRDVVAVMRKNEFGGVEYVQEKAKTETGQTGQTGMTRADEWNRMNSVSNMATEVPPPILVKQAPVVRGSSTNIAPYESGNRTSVGALPPTLVRFSNANQNAVPIVYRSDGSPLSTNINRFADISRGVSMGNNPLHVIPGPLIAVNSAGNRLHRNVVQPIALNPNSNRLQNNYLQPFPPSSNTIRLPNPAPQTIPVLPSSNRLRVDPTTSFNRLLSPGHSLNPVSPTVYRSPNSNGTCEPYQLLSPIAARQVEIELEGSARTRAFQCGQNTGQLHGPASSLASAGIPQGAMASAWHAGPVAMPTLMRTTAMVTPKSSGSEQLKTTIGHVGSTSSALAQRNPAHNKKGFQVVHPLSVTTVYPVSRDVTSAKLNSDLSCSERIMPSPPMTSQPSRMSPKKSPPALLFRPVSPANQMDTEDCAYAYALNESANSPDIEHMLAGESPARNNNTSYTTSSLPKPATLKVSSFSARKPGSVTPPKSAMPPHSNYRSPVKFVFTSTGIVRANTKRTQPHSKSPNSAHVSGSSSPAGRANNPAGYSPFKGILKASDLDKYSEEKSDQSDTEHVGNQSLDISTEGKENEDVFETNTQSSSSNDSDASHEKSKKRKTNLNIIHKRLEKKLPSPVRETSSGDLYRDPSELTREERALQRAMLRFSEMEMKEKGTQKKGRKRSSDAQTEISTEVQVKEEVSSPSDTVEEVAEEKKAKDEAKTKGKDVSASRWLQKVKKKQRMWLTQRHKILKKNTASTKKESVVESTPLPDVTCAEIEPEQSVNSEQLDAPAGPSSAPDSAVPNSSVPKVKAKKRKKSDKLNEESKPKKKKKLKKKLIKSEFNEDKAPEVLARPVSEAPQDELTLEEKKRLKRKKKLKKKKLLMKKKMREERLAKKRKRRKIEREESMAIDQEKIPDALPAPPSDTRGAAFQAPQHNTIVKTYMLVASYHGFKDFEPIVMQSRTRRKGQPSTETVSTPEVAKPKPEFPLLVVESVNCKPVKETVVAKNEEVQKLVTECLRIHGKWHGDELEQALKREEASLGEEVTRLRDSRKLTVNRTTGETILHKAARLGYDEIVKQCIIRGSDPNAKDNAGWTPLHEACARGKLSVVKVLTRYGADANAYSNDGIRPLHDAAEGGHVDIIRVLLAHGADPMLATYAGNTAYACAKEKNTKRLLKEYIVDIGRGRLESQDITDGWDFAGSCSVLDAPCNTEGISGIWDDIPNSFELCEAEFEVSDRPHLPTYNLPVIKDGVVIGRKNYLLVQDLYDKANVAKTSVQKYLKHTDSREIPWTEFLELISQNSICTKPSCPPEGTSDSEPVARLVPLNYTSRRLLNIRVEPCR